jgi:hypothetical protein
MSQPLSQTGKSVENVMLCSDVGIEAIDGSPSSLLCSNFIIKCTKPLPYKKKVFVFNVMNI